MKLKIAHNENELKKILLSKDLDLRYFNAFISAYNNLFNSEYNKRKDWSDDDLREELKEMGSTFQTALLEKCLEFYRTYTDQRNIGFTEEWTLAFIENQKEKENSDDAFVKTYRSILVLNEQLANSSLQLYFDKINLNEGQRKFYSHILKNNFEPYPKSVLQTTIEYTQLFNSQNDKGKSYAFAHHFAYQKTIFEMSEMYSGAYAFAMDSKLNEGHHQEEVEYYAMRYAEMIEQNSFPIEGLKDDLFFNYCLDDLAIRYPELKELIFELKEKDFSEDYITFKHKMVQRFGDSFKQQAESFFERAIQEAEHGLIHSAINDAVFATNLMEFATDKKGVESMYGFLAQIHCDQGQIKQAKKYYELGLNMLNEKDQDYEGDLKMFRKLKEHIDSESWKDGMDD